jgi:hypothetical protein
VVVDESCASLHLVPPFQDEIGSHSLAIVLERNPLNRHEFLQFRQPGDEMADIAIATPQDDLEKRCVDSGALLLARRGDLLDCPLRLARASISRTKTGSAFACFNLASSVSACFTRTA